MRDSILDIVVRLLRFQRVPQVNTEVFRYWSHDNDLLPKLQRQVEIALESYGKFETVVYDTQGIRDDGSDVVLRYRDVSEDVPPRLIGFQIKSFTDLGKKLYLQELKAQRDDTFRRLAGLEYYFIVLCTDEKKHKGRIRQIEAAFRDAPLTEVIEPSYAISFLQLPQTRIDSLIKRSMEADDVVLQKAFEMLEMSSPTARALALYLAVQSSIKGVSTIGTPDLMESGLLRRTYEELRNKQEEMLQGDLAQWADESTQIDGGFNDPDEDEEADDDEEEDDEDVESTLLNADRILRFEDQLAVDLELLSGDIVDPVAGIDSFHFSQDRFLPLVAVISDALVRYEYDTESLFPYLSDLFGIYD